MKAFVLGLLLTDASQGFLIAPTGPARLLQSAVRPAFRRRTSAITADGISAKLAKQLDEVRNLRPAPLDNKEAAAAQAALWEAAGLDPTFKVSGIKTGEPSFTRLFSHATWAQYTGVSPIRRWLRCIETWRFSTVFASLWPMVTFFAAWAYVIAMLPARFLPRTSPIPLTLMGSAIGLLLVFRTNNTYQRLSEARLLWGRAVFLCREVAQTTATALFFDEALGQISGAERAAARQSAQRICCLLAAWAWELNAKLTGPTSIRASTLYNDDVLKVLLPAEEVNWLLKSRSRPVQLLGMMRRTLQAEYKAGRLPFHVHSKLEEDVGQLGLVVGGCERLFSSPVPPTMSRHVVRCLLLWFLALPIVLAGSMHPASVSLWVAVTSYIFIGIEEVGVQVEQPFEIMPMTQLCSVIMFNLAEAFETPPGFEEM